MAGLGTDDVSIESTESEDYDSDQEYLVDRILAQKKEGGTDYYLISWDGYPLESSTWEPRENITDETILEHWNERRKLEASGAKPKFDLASFNAKVQASNKAKKRQNLLRKEKRKRLGIAVSSDSDRYEDESEEAEEVNGPVEDDSKRSRKSKSLQQNFKKAVVQHHSPSKTRAQSSDYSDDSENGIFVGDVKKGRMKTRKAATEKQISRPSTKSTAGRKKSSRAVQSNNLSQNPMVSSPHEEAPAPKSNGQVPRPNQDIQAPLASTSRPDQLSADTNIPQVRGTVAKRGRLSAPVNVFARRPDRGPPKKRPNIIESSKMPDKDPKLYSNMHIRYAAEKAGKGLADAPPDLESLGGLFNPARPQDISTIRPSAIRKASNNNAPDPEVAREEDIAPAILQRPVWRPIDGTNAICFFYFTNTCYRGYECDFQHSSDSRLPIGPDPGYNPKLPPILPSPNPNQPPSNLTTRRSHSAVCYFWGTNNSCANGSDCTYQHSWDGNLPLAPPPPGWHARPSKPATQYDSFKPRYAESQSRSDGIHGSVKSCEAFLKGDCENGDSCFYPHIRKDPQPNLPRFEASITSNDAQQGSATRGDPIGPIRKSVSFAEPHPPSNLIALDEPMTLFNEPEALDSFLPTTTELSKPPSTRISVDDYKKKQALKSKTPYAKNVYFGSAASQPIAVRFEDLALDQQPWKELFSSLTDIRLDLLCLAQDFQASQGFVVQKVEGQGSLLHDPLNHSTSQAVNQICNSLRLQSAGLVYTCAEFSILVYPFMEEWSFLQGTQDGHNGLRYLIFKSAIDISAALHTTDVLKPYNRTLVKKVHGLSSTKLLPYQKPGVVYHIYLCFPPSANLLAQFLRRWIANVSSNYKVYTSNEEGSWDFIVNESTVTAGAVLIHENTLPYLPNLPSLWTLIEGRKDKSFNFWYVADSGSCNPLFEPPAGSVPGQISITRLLPHGQAIFLPPSFLIAEPERLLELLQWFRSKAKKSQTGTYKLVCCYNIREYLLRLALDKSVERDVFQEEHRDIPAKDAIEEEKGLTWRTCNTRFLCHSKIVELLSHDIAEDDLELYDSDRPSEDGLIVSGPEFIDQDDEKALVAWFAGWAMTKLDLFRRFTVVGSQSSSLPRATRFRDVQVTTSDIGTTSNAKAKALGVATKLGQETPARPRRAGHRAGEATSTLSSNLVSVRKDRPAVPIFEDEQMEIDSQIFEATIKTSTPRSSVSAEKPSIAKKVIQFEPTTQWYPKLKAEGEGWEHILVTGFRDYWKTFGISAVER
ncbi:hypothetical protein B0O99DRAFT_218739 [Bisporella sp. PMI_857]|nr:hypothetical protein B0O99DRAFT_218739 [Bisporella sp. PMI_857]